MPTAIVRFHTPEGWVIAADGRQGRSDAPDVVDKVRKVFPIMQPRRSLAYALAGNVGISDPTEKKIVVDFVSEAAKAGEELATSKPADLLLYANKFSRRIYNTLTDAQRKKEIVELPIWKFDDNQPGDTIAMLFILGYFEGQSISVSVRFFHRSQKLAVPQAVMDDIRNGHQPVIYGSAKVAKRFFDVNDPLFASLRTFQTLPTFEQLTISSAAKIAEGYIKACATREGSEIDPDRCPNIGGLVHIAKITPAEGFGWVAGYEPDR